MKRGRLILLIIVLILIILQFFPGLPENKEEVAGQSFTEVHQTPTQIKSILKSSCYDCHSNTASWPWYAHVAPLSLWIGDHVAEGRHHLNFSEWAGYDAEKRDHKLEEFIEMIEEGEMPLESYTYLHSEADLTQEQRQALIDFAKGLRN